MSDLEKLQVENTKLKQVLQDQLDYHHHIGNDDCPYSVNQILCYLYDLANKGLHEMQKI